MSCWTWQGRRRSMRYFYLPHFLAGGHPPPPVGLLCPCHHEPPQEPRGGRVRPWLWLSCATFVVGRPSPLSMPPPTSFQTHQASHPKLPPSRTPKRGDSNVLWNSFRTNPESQTRQAAGGGGAEPPGTAAALFSWQTCVELTRQKAGWEVPVHPLARGGRRVHAGPSLVAWLGRTF